MAYKMKSNGVYKRKTKDVWCIETNWGYGWETESEYDFEDYDNPRKSAYEDAEEYRLAGAMVRVVKRREKLYSATPTFE